MRLRYPVHMMPNFFNPPLAALKQIKRIASIVRAVQNLVQRFVLRPADLERPFEVQFYRSFNDDLPKSWTDEALLRHYLRDGRREGRPPNSAVFMEPLIETFGDLPANFQAKSYQLLNPDIAASYANPWAATEHYLKYGKREHRRYFNVNYHLYASLNSLGHLKSIDDVAIHFNSNQHDLKLLRSGADFMRMRGLGGGGAWLERLNFLEFKALNWAWAFDAPDIIHAADLILAEGGRRSASLAFDLHFDPAYYREAHPDLSELSNVDLYYQWLFSGLEDNEAGSAEARLKQLGLDLNTYPLSFDWTLYVSGAKPPLARQRWSALEHFLKVGVLYNLPPLVSGEDPKSFLSGVARSLSHRQNEVSVTLYQEASRYGALAALESQDLADNYYRLKDWSVAASLYESVALCNAGNVWTIVNGTRARLELGDVLGACSFIERFGDRFRGERQFRNLCREVAEAMFAEASAKARLFYKQGDRDFADTVLTTAVEVVAAFWGRLDPLGADVPMGPECKIIMLANVDLRQCTHYRVEQKAEILKRAGANFEIFSADKIDDFMDQLPGAMAAIFYRLPAFPGVVRAIDAARAYGVPSYYEIDDLIFENDYPDTLESYGGGVDEEEYVGLLFGVPLFRAAMSRCEYGISSTDSLAQHMAAQVKTGQVFTVLNGLDSRNLPEQAASIARKRQDDDVIIFYGSGTKAHNSDFLDLVAPALVDLLRENSQAKFVIVGYLVLDSRFDALKDQIVQISFVSSVREYWSILAEANINLAPLHPSAVTDAKSEIKWLEAAVLGIPSIVSNTQAYVDVLDKGVDALIASTPADWRLCLQTLMSSPERRASVAAAAQAKALALYSLDANARRMATALAPAMLKSTRLLHADSDAPRKPRVMLVNTFFPPQTIGGATRVVRDNLDFFMKEGERPDRLGSGWEFAVVTSDPAVPEVGHLRVDNYNGVPVFRISTPAEANMDWRPFNDDVGLIFGRLLDIWVPDVVHFHATQRLTASALHECQLRRIPYLVTVHDAWWICDQQFMVDEEGNLIDPSVMMAMRPPAGVGFGAALSRKRALKVLLSDATAVLSVSETFASFYELSGVPIVSLPNGIKEMAPVRRTSSIHGRVRLAHIGGRSLHKGYHLIEAALRQGSFLNLELTVVDHRYSGGLIRTDLWGATPVQTVGMTPQEAMGNFYAGQDVLLAASIWPESFGLVAREALAAGLWVIASSRGAMGEDVRDGENGYVIDVSSPQGLYDVFEALNADPLRYQAPPPPVNIRSSDVQGEELLKLYSQILTQAGSLEGI